MTKITTGDSPHPKQCLYGERALDQCLDFAGIAGGNNTENEFDMATFFCMDKPRAGLRYVEAPKLNEFPYFDALDSN